MTPERRAKKYLDAEWTSYTPEEHKALVRAIRAAENAAIKRCAERAQELANRSPLFDRAYTYDRIMDLKSRKPAAARGKR